MSGEVYRLASRIKHRFGRHNRPHGYSIAPRCDWCGHRSAEQKAVARRSREELERLDANTDAAAGKEAPELGGNVFRALRAALEDRP